MTQRVTLKDIARETGFSVMTVSQVLNGNKANHASEKNRALIKEVAQRLNYLPNLNARRLVTKQSNVIGLLNDRRGPSFNHDTMNILEELAVKSGMRLQIGMSHNNFDSISGYIEDFRGNGISNVICLGHSYPEFGFKIPALLNSFEHVVFLEKPTAPTRFPYVGTDHFLNFHVITSALLKFGYRRIVSIRSNYRDNAFFEAQRGMRQAYSDAELPFDDKFWIASKTDGDDSPESAAANLEMALPQKPDVLILSNDIVVLNTIRMLHAKGINVPTDIAVFSAALSNYAAITFPTISGIDYNAPVLAKSLFKALFSENSQNDNQERNDGILVPANIIWRETCPLQ